VTDRAGGQESGRLLTGSMLGIALGSVLVPLNSTMLAVALPSVMDDFAVDAATVASLVTLYLAAVVIALPASGALGDRFGHRRTFLVGVLAFGAASALAATASSFVVLAGSRVLQALSGALVSTSSTALVRAEAPAGRRGAAFGAFDVLVSVAAAIGPFAGGLVVSAFGWRAMFLLAAPVALAALAVVGWLAPPRGRDADGARRTPRTTDRPIDLVGLALLALALIAALISIRGRLDDALGIVATLAVIPLTAAFVVVELRIDHPAVDPRLLARPPFAAALIGVFGLTVVLHGCFIVVPLLVERVQGGSPATGGLVLLGISALWAVAAPFGGRLSDALGRRRPAVIGSIVTVVGLALLWAVGATSGTVVLGGLLALVGFGMGLAGSPRQTAAMEAVEPERAGMAAGTYYTGRYLGGVVGASLAGAVLGQAVTAAGASTTFGLLALVAVVVVAASMFLPAGTRRA
jgi:EmrB/QacA subfamily drug resistance transporter